MKRYLLFITLASFFATSGFAKTPDVPEAVKTSFNKLYPKVQSAKWDKEDGDYEASFTVDKVNNSVKFDPAGNVVETEVAIPTESLPANAAAYVGSHYGKKALKGAAKITDAKGVVNYEAEIKGKDVLFDVNGNFLKEAKD